MKTVVITAGHSNTDSGAVNGKRSEAHIVTDMRNMVAMYLQRYGLSVITDGTGLDNKPLNHAVKLIKQGNIAIEFHCNASANKSASGTEALAKPKDKLLAQALCKAVSNIMGTKLRGDKGYQPENAGQHKRLAYVSNGGIILELFFISNDEELAIWDNKKWLVAKEVSTAILKYLNQ